MTPGRRDPRGFVVAGGASVRMGRDKASLEWGFSTLLDHAIERVRAACGDATILCGREARFADRAPIAVDTFPGLGPLGALHKALEMSATPHVLLLAVDMPRVPLSLLEHLAAEAGSADIVVPHTGDGPEPLCATYSERCLEPVLRNIDAGRNKMTDFWAGLDVREVGPVALARFGDPGQMFANVNAPSDYEALRAEATER